MDQVCARNSSLFILHSKTLIKNENASLMNHESSHGKPVIAGVGSIRLKKAHKANTARPCKFDAAVRSQIISETVENAVKNQLPPTG
jgi:hypothetical protein